MGYYISLYESNAVIPVKNLQAAYRTVCELDKRDDLKKYGNTKDSTPWFGCLGSGYPANCPDLKSVLELAGFEMDVIDGDLHFCECEIKATDEYILLATLAPFIESDDVNDIPYLVWKGEDTEMWMNEFVNGKMYALDGRVVYDTRTRKQVSIENLG